MDKRTYRIWADMKQRCNNNNNKDMMERLKDWK